MASIFDIARDTLDVEENIVATAKKNILQICKDQLINDMGAVRPIRMFRLFYAMEHYHTGSTVTPIASTTTTPLTSPRKPIEELQQQAVPSAQLQGSDMQQKQVQQLQQQMAKLQQDNEKLKRFGLAQQQQNQVLQQQVNEYNSKLQKATTEYEIKLQSKEKQIEQLESLLKES